MDKTSPRIGFDRALRLEWLSAALVVKAGLHDRDFLDSLLVTAGLGQEAEGKTRTKLNGLVLSPRPSVIDFLSRGQTLAASRQYSQASVLAYAWGASLVVYPFFGRVNELLGRLFSLQGDCTSTELHRRLGEQFGVRHNIKVATRELLKSLLDWGVLERSDPGFRLKPRVQPPLLDEGLTLWLWEAALLFLNRPQPLAHFATLGVLFPFSYEGSAAYLVSRSSELELRTEGTSQQLIALRAWTTR